MRIPRWFWIPAGTILLICLFFEGSYQDNSQSLHPVSKDSAVCPVRYNYFLPEELKETSGLAWFDGLLWTINDSGNEPVVFAFSPEDGLIKKRFRLINGKNVDWEDLTIADGWLYIGDFGNNDGSRKDLCVYSISLDNLAGLDQDVTARKIEFNYKDQNDFQPALFHTHWDAEAFLVHRDTIYIFTKNWIEGGSQVYFFPMNKGKQTALRTIKLNFSGMATSASFSRDKKRIAICGYDDFQPFISLIPVGNFLEKTELGLKKISCDSLYGIQTEGIAFGPENELYLSSESSVIPQSLFRYAPGVLVLPDNF